MLTLQPKADLLRLTDKKTTDKTDKYESKELGYGAHNSADKHFHSSGTREEGISIVPEYSHPWDVGTENVVFVPLAGEEEKEEILIVWRKSDDNPALKHFIEKLPHE